MKAFLPLLILPIAFAAFWVLSTVLGFPPHARRGAMACAFIMSGAVLQPSVLRRMIGGQPDGIAGVAVNYGPWLVMGVAFLWMILLVRDVLTDLAAATEPQRAREGAKRRAPSGKTRNDG